MRKPYTRRKIFSAPAPWPRAAYVFSNIECFPQPFWQLGRAYAKRCGLKWGGKRHKPVLATMTNVSVSWRALEPGEVPPMMDREGFWLRVAPMRGDRCSS